MAKMHPERPEGNNTTGSTLWNCRRILCRRRDDTKGMASRPLVADHPTGRPTVLSRVRSVPMIRPTHGTCTHAAPTGATFGTVPKRGAGFRHMPRRTQATSTSLSPPTIVRSGWRPNRSGIIPRPQQTNSFTSTSSAGFGCPIELISDQGSHFLDTVIDGLTHHYAVVHKRSTSYYPQANGLAESTNKTLSNILRKIVNKNRKD